LYFISGIDIVRYLFYKICYRIFSNVIKYDLVTPTDWIEALILKLLFKALIEVTIIIRKELVLTLNLSTLAQLP